ncbi:MAG: hypothetical protein IJO22_01400 [Oscillospiraceae bacterium]|nr:hypothetical protein [Oscillospiraceae bacterium]
MKAEEFVFALNEANDKFITEPFEENKTAKILHFKKWAALAACICLIVASATVVIAEIFDIGFNIFDYQMDDTTGKYTAEGYTLTFDIGTYPVDSFEEMEELREGIQRRTQRIMYASEITDPVEREKFIERKGLSTVIDVIGEHSYEKFFGNREAAIEYTGFEGFEFPDFKLNYEKARVCLRGYSGEELTSLSVRLIDNFQNDYDLDEYNINYTMSAKVFFENEGTVETIPFVADEGETFTEERYTNENGIEYLVVKLKTAEGKTRRINAFLIKNDILYEASMYGDFAKEEFEKHEDFIHNWANFY